jgi:hypothetical protein
VERAAKALSGTNRAQKQLPSFTAPKFRASAGENRPGSKHFWNTLQRVFTAPKFSAVVGDALRKRYGMFAPSRPTSSYGRTEELKQ